MPQAALPNSARGCVPAMGRGTEPRHLRVLQHFLISPIQCGDFKFTTNELALGLDRAAGQKNRLRDCRAEIGVFAATTRR